MASTAEVGRLDQRCGELVDAGEDGHARSSSNFSCDDLKDDRICKPASELVSLNDNTMTHVANPITTLGIVALEFKQGHNLKAREMRRSLLDT